MEMKLVENNALWKNVLKFRYGGVKHRILMEKSCKSKSSTSTWWKDMKTLEA